MVELRFEKGVFRFSSTADERRVPMLGEDIAQFRDWARRYGEAVSR